jgi:hypothetical protein
MFKVGDIVYISYYVGSLFSITKEKIISYSNGNFCTELINVFIKKDVSAKIGEKYYFSNFDNVFKDLTKACEHFIKKVFEYDIK